MRGEIPDDTINETKAEEPNNTHFTNEEMDLLREKLGPMLVHGTHTLQELKELIASDSVGPSTKYKRS